MLIEEEILLMINKKDSVLFRFVPTMKCNFRCQYCFVSNAVKENAETMFDKHSVNEWVEGLNQFDDYNIELYFWGGEPFCIDGTYVFLREAVKKENIISGFRIDTNAYFADRIVRDCPSSKIKLNCSYHMQYHSLNDIFSKVKLLKKYDMVGMVNYVASEYNLSELKNKYGMNVKDLIEKFAEIDVFVNVAGDFKYANNPHYERYKEYKEFIMQFISPEEWDWLRGKEITSFCSAGQKMFTVNHNGDFTSCISNEVYGNYFEGILKPAESELKCSKCCKSIISYPFRKDNDFESVNSLLKYVKRNQEYRNRKLGKFKDFLFD